MKYLIFIIALFFMFSCGKKRTVSGRVYNPITDTGIADVTVAISKDKVCLGYDGCGTKLLESTTTDANGYYSMTYRDKGSRNLSFDYYNSNQYYSLNSKVVKVSGNQVYDLLLVPEGNLQRTITNTSCFDTNDSFVRTSYTHEYVSELNSYTTATYSGCFNQTYSNNSVPMGWWFWKGTVTKNNITTSFADSVYVPEGGSVQWVIEY